MQITKEKLQQIYYENTSHKAAKILKISIPTLHKYLKIAGVKLKGRGYGNSRRKNKIKII